MLQCVKSVCRLISTTYVLRLNENLSEEANRKWPIGNRMVTSSHDRRRHVTLKGPDRDPNHIEPSISKTAGDAI